MGFGLASRKKSDTILSKLQIMTPEDALLIVRTILDQEFEVIDGKTYPVPAAEKAVRIGILLMCLDVPSGTVIANEIRNRLQ
jgi:hypothetical protein